MQTSVVMGLLGGEASVMVWVVMVGLQTVILDGLRLLRQIDYV